SVALQFRDEIVDIAAVPGTGEFDDAAIFEEAAPLDVETGAAGTEAEQAGLRGSEYHGAEALQRAQRTVAELVERLVERILHEVRIGQEVQRHRAAFDRQG